MATSDICQRLLVKSIELLPILAILDIQIMKIIYIFTLAAILTTTTSIANPLLVRHHDYYPRSPVASGVQGAGIIQGTDNKNNNQGNIVNSGIIAVGKDGSPISGAGGIQGTQNDGNAQGNIVNSGIIATGKGDFRSYPPAKVVVVEDKLADSDITAIGGIKGNGNNGNIVGSVIGSGNDGDSSITAIGGIKGNGNNGNVVGSVIGSGNNK